jgi:hypothetical protein
VKTAPVSVPWPFLDKFGNTSPQAGEFLEAGLDLTALFGASAPHFASFVAETRSSTSPTATLSDFAAAGLNTIGTTYQVKTGQYVNTVTVTAIDQGTGGVVTATDQNFHYGTTAPGGSASFGKPPVVAALTVPGSAANTIQASVFSGALVAGQGTGSPASLGNLPVVSSAGGSASAVNFGAIPASPSGPSELARDRAGIANRYFVRQAHPTRALVVNYNFSPRQHRIQHGPEIVDHVLQEIFVFQRKGGLADSVDSLMTALLRGTNAEPASSPAMNAIPVAPMHRAFPVLTQKPRHGFPGPRNRIGRDRVDE